MPGAANAGRPMVLEGGLDWKAMALTPADMDFMEAQARRGARDRAGLRRAADAARHPRRQHLRQLWPEANRAFWRGTVVPLVRRVADDLGFWLAPAFGGGCTLVPDLDGVEALAEDRAALVGRGWAGGFPQR